MTSAILETMAGYAGMRVAADMEVVAYDQMMAMATNLPKSNHRFSKTIAEKGLTLICEIRKASPKEGVIDPVFNYKDMVKAYERAGADLICCPTETKWYMGSGQIFTDIRNKTRLPMVRREILVDAYQIYQSKTMGADAVTMQCGLGDEGTLAYYMDVCDQLGIDAVVEAEDEAEIRMAVAAGAKIIAVQMDGEKAGVIDMELAMQARTLIPGDVLLIAETASEKVSDVAALRECGADAVMICEMLVKAPNAAELIRKIKDQ